jgi:hypothetical protein
MTDTTHTSTHRYFLLAVSIAVVLILTVVPAGLAAKGGNGGDSGHGKPGGGGSASSLTLVVVSSPYSDGLPHFTGQVTFDVVTTEAKPWVNVSCYQNGNWVSGQWHGFWEGYQFGRVFTLGPTPSWTGGGADCTARLATISKTGRETTLATTMFYAHP